MLLAIAMVGWSLQVPPPKASDPSQSSMAKLKRIDFIGAFFLCATILSFCLILDLGGEQLSWTSPRIYAFIATGLCCMVAFIVSARLVPEPIFPLRLVSHWAVVSNYLIIVLQVMTQMSLMLSIPLYFQATANASTAAAGAYLIPAFAGNTLGGLLAGFWIKWTGRFKPATIAAPTLSLLCMTLLYLIWNGETSPAMSLLIFPGGFATGVISSSAFVGIAAGVSAQDMAITASGMYLFFNIGAIAGVSAGSAVFQDELRASFTRALRGVDNREEVGLALRNTAIQMLTILPDHETRPSRHRLCAESKCRGSRSAHTWLRTRLPLRQSLVRSTSLHAHLLTRYQCLA